MNKAKFCLVLAAVFAIVATVSVTVWAYTTWTHTITGTISENTDFSVFRDEDLQTAWASGGTTSVGSSATYTETYWIRNDGNVAILVSPAGTWTGTGTATWSASPISIPVGQKASISVTLTGMTVGTWSYTFTFTSTKAG